MRRIFSFVFTFLVLLPSFTMAVTPACHSLYTEFTPAVFERPLGSLIKIHKRKEFLTALDRQEIQEIFSDTKLNMKAKIYKAYEIYNAARLRSYSPAERAEVEKILNSIHFSFNDHTLIANVDQVSVPYALESSAILMGILAHEREHRAQLYRYMGSYREINWNKEILPLYLAQAYGFRTKFFLERDAMRAEWEAMNSLPPEAIQHSIDILEKTEMDAFAKTSFLRMLKNSRMTQDEYIKTEHKNGRYSHLANIKEAGYSILMNLIILIRLIYPA